jgi:dipeptidase
MRKVVAVLVVWLLSVSVTLACTIIAAGKNATVDGSVILSHTDAGLNSRIHYVPPRTYAKGDKAPVYWGIQDPSRPLDDFGEVLGTATSTRPTRTSTSTSSPSRRARPRSGPS